MCVCICVCVCLEMEWEGLIGSHNKFTSVTSDTSDGS